MIDNRGTKLERGQTVAYNISGQVALGEIVSDVPLNRAWGKERIKIKLLHQAAGRGVGHVSTVTNPHNLLVMRKETA